MTPKDKYRQLCAKESSIPIFSRDWWLDATVGIENWDVVLAENGSDITGSMPYVIRERFGFRLLTQPELTQKLGPWIRPPQSGKSEKIISHQHDVMRKLINGLPRYDYFLQNWHYDYRDWLPFFWAGFSQSTRYTYVIDKLDDPESVFNEFSHSKRKNIKRAEDLVSVRFDLDSDHFYDNHEMTLRKQGEKISYSKKLFKSIYRACYERSAGKTIYAQDAAGNIHSALFVIWDEVSAYDLISTIDPDFRNSGSATLLIREIIRFLSGRTLRFDFEGSMVEGIESSFRQFSTKQMPYFSISKTPSRLLRAYMCLRSIL
jgi:hypothetical protein